MPIIVLVILVIALQLVSDAGTTEVPDDPVATEASSCPLARPGSAIDMTLEGCTTVASDTAADPDPLSFWGKVECEEDSRHQQLSSGGDTRPRGDGAPQGDEAFRRLTVVEGDDYYGERCELGDNDEEGPTVLYEEGERRVTFISIRLPSGTDPAAEDWRTVAQMKQTKPYYNPQLSPVFELQVRGGSWVVESSWNDLWSAPAEPNVWTRFAFDITYSSDPAIGSIKAYVDLDRDGDANDDGEQSPVLDVATLRPEVGGGESPYDPGEAIPSHLRTGLYQNPDYRCPSGCSVDIDNIQVLAP